MTPETVTAETIPRTADGAIDYEALATVMIRSGELHVERVEGFEPQRLMHAVLAAQRGPVDPQRTLLIRMLLALAIGVPWLVGLGYLLGVLP